MVQPRFRKVSRNTVYKDGYKIYEHEIIALKHLFAIVASKISLTKYIFMVWKRIFTLFMHDDTLDKWESHV